MAKRALCVGINDYPIAGMDLKGCVNDAKGWANVLVDRYDFGKPDVKLLLDRRATKANMVKEIKALLAGSKRGDTLVFTNSSHGTYVADRSGDEKLYDEAICPWDTKDELLVDDELRELFSGLKTGVRLTVISDSCHSGSLTRQPPPGRTPDDRRMRFLNPKKIGLPVIDDVQRQARPRRGEVYPEDSMKELLLSGCKSDEYSYDAKFGRRYNGAMTYMALAAIGAAGPRLTFAGLHQQILKGLEDANFNQTPQLEGRSSNRKRVLFA
jgi:metacaspase-1